MILRDQYFLTCDKSLQTFLKEKGKLSLREMTKAANYYYDAHGYPSDNHENKLNKTKQFIPSKQKMNTTVIQNHLLLQQAYIVTIVA